MIMISGNAFKKTAVIFTIILLSFMLMLYCKKQIKNNNDNTLVLEYKKEGFISDNLFRVVIVNPKENAGYDLKNIEDVAKRRAFVSLQRYLSSNNRIITSNVNTNLFNMIDQNGKLKHVTQNETRDVYFMEIQKENLKQYIDGLADKR